MSAYSKAEKRKAKKARVQTLYEKWEADSVTTNEADNPTETVMQARARHAGAAPSHDMLAPVWCEPAGRALAIGAPDEYAKLFALFVAYDSAMRTYSRIVLGRSRHPAVSKLEFMQERFETRADDVIDLRSEDERIADARESHARWVADLGKLRSWDRIIIERAALQTETMQICGQLTSAGRSFVAAMIRLAEVVDHS